MGWGVGEGSYKYEEELWLACKLQAYSTCGLKSGLEWTSYISNHSPQVGLVYQRSGQLDT